MQNDIIKRPPADPEARVAEKPVEAPTDEAMAQQSVAPESASTPVVDVVKTQEVTSNQADPTNDEIKPDDKPKGKQKAEERATHQDQAKAPSGPGVAIGAAIFVCLILIGIVVYSQMKN